MNLSTRGDWTVVGQLRVTEQGRVSVGVAVAPGLIMSVGSVRLEDQPGQADNVSVDRDGWVRWFMLSAIVSKVGTLPIRVAPAYLVSSRPAIDEPERSRTQLLRQEHFASASIDADKSISWRKFAGQEVAAADQPQAIGTPPVATDVVIGDESTANAPKVFVESWRRGPIVTEAIYQCALASSGLLVRFYEARWADGAGRTTVVIENPWAKPNTYVQQGNTWRTNVLARTRRYDCTIARGPAGAPRDRLIYRDVVHVPFTRWLRRVGAQEVFAEVVPRSGGGNAWDHLRQTRMLQNLQTRLPRPDVRVLRSVPDVPFPVSSGPAVGNYTDPRAVGTGMIGPFTRYQGAEGGNPDIGPHPAYYMAALQHYDQEMAWWIDTIADLRQGGPGFIRDSESHNFYRPDHPYDLWLGANAYSMVGTAVRADDDSFVGNQIWTPSHWPAMFYIPYLLTGRFEYLEGQVAQQHFSYLRAPANVIGRNGVPEDNAWCGNRMSRHVWNYAGSYRDEWIGGAERPQWRSAGWGVRTTMHLLAILPSDDARVRTLVAWDRTTTAALWTNVCRNLRQRYCIDATGPGKRFSEDGVRFPGGAYGPGAAYPQWMFHTGITSMAHGIELGQMPPEGVEFWRWYMQTVLLVLTHPDPDRGALIKQWGWPKLFPDNRPVRTVAELFEAARAHRLIGGGGEPDWAGYHFALAVYAVDNGLPRAEAALAWARANLQPNYNHRMEPRQG